MPFVFAFAARAFSPLSLSLSLYVCVFFVFSVCQSVFGQLLWHAIYFCAYREHIHSQIYYSIVLLLRFLAIAARHFCEFANIFSFFLCVCSCCCFCSLLSMFIRSWEWLALIAALYVYDLAHTQSAHGHNRTHKKKKIANYFCKCEKDKPFTRAGWLYTNSMWQ